MKTSRPTLPAAPAGRSGYSAARPGNNPAWDAQDETQEKPDGDPASVKNEGVLDSLGKAVSSPVIESDHGPSRPGPGRKPA